MAVKKCPKCGETKDETLFYKSKGRPAVWCKECHDSATNNWRERNRERANDNCRRSTTKWRESRGEA